MVKGTINKTFERLDNEKQKVLEELLNNIGYDGAEETRSRKERGSSLERNQGRDKAELLSKESSSGRVMEGHDGTIGDYVHGQSATLAEEAQESGEGAAIGNETVDLEAVNDDVEKNNESNFDTLSGVSMPEWVTDKNEENAKLRKVLEKKGKKLKPEDEYQLDLKTDRVLVRRHGAEPDDNMNKFNAWMRNCGVKFDNIVSDELPQILAKNPHTKIKFACVRPEHNATNDYDMISHLLLVVDYDSNVRAAHNEDNGGVFENEGQKYLIVGVAGYGDRNNAKNNGRLALYDNIYGGGSKNGMLQQDKKPYFDSHPSERFRVLQDVYTEVVPGSMIPGWIIRQNEADEAPQSRRISELLADKERNPHGLSLNNLSWSIIEYSQNLDIMKGTAKQVMHPQNQDTNAGRVFVLIPAGNGKLLAAKIDALYYNDAKFNKDSALYQEIQNSLMQLLAPQYNDRYEALLDLFQKLYLTPEGHDILLSKEPDGTSNGITLVRNGQKVHTIFTKAPDFTIQDFLDAIADWNPRINITARVLRDSKLLQKYDEAGALMTDLAKLGTSGVNYSVYGIDAEGKMVKPSDVNWVPDRAESNSDYIDSHRLDVPYMHGVYYQYNIDSGKYSLNGAEVTDKDTIKGLDYARKIIDLSPVKTERAWDYYILNSGDNAEVIRQSSNNKKIEEVTGEDAQRIIKEVEEQQAAAAREAAMQEILKSAETSQTESAPEIDEGSFTVDEESGSLNILDSFNASQQEEDKAAAPQPLENSPTPAQPSASSSPQVDNSPTTKNFSQTMRGVNRTKVTEALKQKWPDAPYNSLRQLESFLKEKGLQLDSIPVDEIALNAWIHNNIVCK